MIIQPTYSYTYPGLPGGPLRTDYPVYQKMIPAANTHQRPGILAAYPRVDVQHGTGNDNSMAPSESDWLVYSKAGGAQVSFHSTADDNGVYVCVPANEVTWQAADGAGIGNMNGYSCEMIENVAMWASRVRALRAIYITADWMGRIAARLGILIPQQHWNFNYLLPPSLRHDCPNKLRYRTIDGKLAWDIYVAQWNESRADELKRMGGTVITPPVDNTAYAPAIPVPALNGFTIEKNAIAEGVVTDEGTTYIWVADVVEALEKTPRLQRAAAGAKRVGPDIKAGERFVVSWLFQANDKRWYYLTPYNTRVLYRGAADDAVPTCKRIDDAPLVPGSEHQPA